MFYLTVMNYNTGEIFIHHLYDSELNGTIEDYLTEKGYNLDEISYMCSDSLNVKLC